MMSRDNQSQMMFEQERKKSTFKRKELSYLIYGGKEQYESFMERQAIIEKDPILKWNPSFIHKSRADVMKHMARVLIRYMEVFPYDNLHQLELGLYYTIQTPLSLHYFMFLTTLRNLCDDQQVKMFLKPAEEGHILGCYAQTELAHGSDVQNLQTLATYDQKTELFTLHTPSVGGAKWWIGDLGVYCTHACVFAQLIVKNKRYGVHAFVVPIRNAEHKLYPGVEAGDVGPKLGFNNKDNGYVIFTDYKVPRKSMLMKFHHLSREGDYQLRGNEKVSYATMLMIRAALPEIGFSHFSKAITILTRYSLVRKQFKDKNGQEIPILNYQLQQEKVLPRISECYAVLMGCKKLRELSTSVFAEAKANKFDRLNQAHIITSACKSIMSADILKGMETLRRAAGGHGFSMYSGIPALIQQYAAAYTLQGEFTVLQLQVARFVLKCLTNLQKGKRLPESAMYLQEVNNPNKFVYDCKQPEDLRNPDVLRQIFLYHSCDKAQKAAMKLTTGVSEGLEMKQAWDQYAGIELVDAGIAHSYLWIYQNFYQMINAETKNQGVRLVLTRLLLLYGVEKILERTQYFYETGTITPNTIRCAQDFREILFAELRPQALNLVEAFDYTDNTLTSAIGTADGKAYENLLHWAKTYNEVNSEPVRKELIQAMKKSKAQLKSPKL